jgi:hypothetical protein
MGSVANETSPAAGTPIAASNTLKGFLVRFYFFFLAISLAGAPALFVQNAAREQAGRAHLVVTAEGHHNEAAPVVQRDDVIVTCNKKPARVSQWVPLRGDESKLQLYLLIDDGLDSSVSLQFEDLKRFIQSQSNTTEIGIGYLRNGSTQIAQALTADHGRAASALRIPLGQPGIAGSPYIALSDLFKKWPAAEARREVLLISSGIDLYYEPGSIQNPYLDRAIADAQRGGIIVHSIYYGGTGHAGHSYWRINWGQNYLSQLADETGGEFFWQGTQNPVSFTPYLKDLAERLNNQYLLTFEPAPDVKPGLQSVKVATERAGVTLVSASKAFLK